METVKSLETRGTASHGLVTSQRRGERVRRQTGGDVDAVDYPCLNPTRNPAANPPEIESVERMVMTQSGGAPVAAS